MPRELLQQVRLIDPVSAIDQVADVLIEDGIIRGISAAIAESFNDTSSNTIVQDCRGLILGPGLVDLYSHSGEPGFEERETLKSLMQAAMAGGFTRVAILPDTVPAVDNPASVAWLSERQQAEGFRSSVRSFTPHSRSADFDVSAQPHSAQSNDAQGNPLSTPSLHCWAALTIGAQGQQMTELSELAQTDIVGFADGRSLTNLLLVRRLLEYLQPLGKPVALWACNHDLAGNGVMREGQDSIRLGLPGIPAIAETTALAALLECIEETGTPVHLMRISTARGVALIQTAKSRGLPITASTTWMHLLLNSDAIDSYSPNLRLDPPLGNPTDQAALLQGVQQGIIDAIAVDHTPYTYEEKTVAFAEAPPGAIGLELALPLLWQTLVETNQWTALELWQRLSTYPASCLQQKPATITVNQPAEFTLFNPHQLWKVNERSLHSRSINTPWSGQEISGRVVKTWCLEEKIKAKG